MFDFRFVSDLSLLSCQESCPITFQRVNFLVLTPQVAFILLLFFSFSVPIHIVPILLGYYFTWKYQKFPLLFSFCPSCCYPPWYLISYYYLGAFPPSLIQVQSVSTHFSISFLFSWIGPCVSTGLDLLSRKSDLAFDTINSNGYSLSLSTLFVYHDLQPEEKRTIPGPLHFSVSYSGLLTRWAVWLLLGKTVIPVLKNQKKGVWDVLTCPPGLRNPLWEDSIPSEELHRSHTAVRAPR